MQQISVAEYMNAGRSGSMPARGRGASPSLSGRYSIKDFRLLHYSEHTVFAISTTTDGAKLDDALLSYLQSLS